MPRENRMSEAGTPTLYTLPQSNAVVTQRHFSLVKRTEQRETGNEMNNCHIFSVWELLTLQNNSENVVWQHKPRKPDR